MTVYRSRHLKKSLFQLFGFWYACVVKRLPFGLQKATYSDGSDLQNAGEKIRKARSRAIRMALRIFISGDKFPVGGNKFRGY